MPVVKEPEKTLEVNRSQLRADQSSILDKAEGRRIVVVKSARAHDGEKYIVDSSYFNSVLERLESIRETMEILVDRRLYEGIMKSADTLDEDMRLGRLHHFEDAFE